MLFRIQGCIIGSSIFKERAKFEEVQVEDGKEYHGMNIFYQDTIFNIEAITLEEYQEIDKDLERFTQSIKKTDMKYFERLLALVEKKWKAYED